MAENLFGSHGNQSTIPVEHLDYSYIKNCPDVKELGKILRVLKSGEEGFYPDLITFCEKRIEEVAGADSKYLRKDKPPSTARDMENEEWQEISSNIRTWTDEMNTKDDLFKKKEQLSNQEENLPPIRSGGTINTDTGQVTLTDEKPFYKPSPDRIKSADYRKWDKFDVDKELDKVDQDEKPYSKPKDTNPSFDIELSIDSSGMTDEERELKANREKDKGNEAFHAKEYAEAAAYYSRSISLIKSAAAYNNRALARIRLEKFKEALDDCNVVLQIEADNVKGYMRRGVAKKGLKDLAGAKKDFQHVLSLEPNNKRAKDLLAEIATEEEKLKKNSKNASKNNSGRRMVIEEVEGSDSSEEEDDGQDNVNNVSKENESTKTVENGAGKVKNSISENENVKRTSEKESSGDDEVVEEVISWTEDDDRKLFGDSVDKGRNGQVNEKEIFQDINGEDSDVVMQDLSNTKDISDVTIEKVNFEKSEHAVNLESDLKSQDEIDGARKSKMSSVEQQPEVQVQSQPPAQQKETRPSPPPAPTVVEAKPPSPPPAVEARPPSPPPPLPDAVVYLKNQGNELYKTGQYGEAIEKYSIAIDKLKPDKEKHAVNLSVLYSNRAASHSKTGDCRSCIADANTALDLTPFSPKPLLRRAAAYETLEKYRDAYVDYQAVFTMDPSSAVAQTGSSRMSKILKELDGPEWRDRLPKIPVGPPVAAAPPIVTTVAQQRDQTQTTTTKTSESSPRVTASTTEVPPPKETVKPYENLSKAEKFKQLKDEGNDRVKKGQYPEAIQKYTACISVDPSQVVSFTNRALCYLRVNEPLKAESDSNTALEMEPENIKALFRRAQARKMLTQYKASLQDLTTLLRLDPKNSAAKKEMELVKEYWRKELREAQQKQNEKNEAEKQAKKDSKQSTSKRQTQKARNRIQIEEVESSSTDDEDVPEPRTKPKKPPSKAKSKGKDSESKKPDLKSPTAKAEKKPKESKTGSPKATEPGKTKQNVKASEKMETKHKAEMKPTSTDSVKRDSSITDTKKQTPKITEVTSKQTESTNEPNDQQSVGNKPSKSKKKGKQKQAAEDPVIQTTSEPVLNKATPYEFMQAWTSLKGRDTTLYAKLLRQVKPEDLPRVLSNKLEGDMLVTIVKAVSEHFVDKGEEDLGYQYLTSLCKAQRFQVVAMFLSDKDKRSVKSVISKLTARTSRVYSDRNLEELMSNYGAKS